MKQIILSLFIGLTVLCTSVVYAKDAKHFWFVDAGMLIPDNSDKPDNEILLGLTYGYGFTPNFSLELDYLMSVSGGGYSNLATGPVPGVTAEEGEYSHWMTSANVVYRHLFGKMLFVKAKLGYMFGEEGRSTNVAGKDDKETIQGVEGGLGAGLLLGPLMGSSTTLEFEWTKHNEELMSFTLGLNMTF